MRSFHDRHTPLLCAVEEQERMRAAQRARDEWIIAAREEGWLVPQIAEALGLPDDIVVRIVRGVA